MIVPDLQPLAVPVDSLRTLEGNARRGDVDAVMRSLDKFGQRKPIVVRADTHEVIAGNHTFMAAKRLGWAQIAVVWVEDDDTTAKAFALADNRTAELGDYDNDLLAAMIAEVQQADADLLAAASYTDADLTDLLSDTAPDEEPEELPVPETRQAPVKLMDRFMGLPVTVFNSREGWWQDRKRAWSDLGIESELGREDKPRTWNLAMPAGHGHQATDMVRNESPDGDDGEGYGDGSTSIFDPVMCELTYRWFSPPGGLVLDPFAGGSVRGVVASKLGRRYVGVDVRQVQVDANVVQGRSICGDGLALVPEVPEDFMPDFTPIERHGDLWMKREDLYAFAGVRGAKVRTCMFLIQQAKDAGVGVVTAGARQSPQVNFVAQIAARMGVKCRCHVPSGGMTPELVAAKSAGAELIQHEAGYNTVIVARAREDAERLGWVEIPYGMESPEAVTFTKPQVRDLPKCKRIVNAVGSGMTLAGILWGLVEQDLEIPVVGVCVGHPPVDRLDRHAPPNWREMVTIVDHPSEYHHEAKVTTYDGVQLDPWYEAKCLDVVEPDDLLWVSAIRPSIVPAVAPMPEWVVGDSSQIGDLDPLAGEQADLWFSCPPYGDLEVYSDDPADLSTMSWDEFLEAYRAIVRDSAEMLADDRFAVIVVGDFRDNKGFYRNFVSETIRAFEDAGLRLYNEAVLVTNLASLILRVGKQFDHSRKLGKSHQNVLTFVKGDPRRATLACGPVQTGDFIVEQDDPDT